MKQSLKQVFGIVMAAAMVITMLAVPVSATLVPDMGLGNYHKFTYGETGDRYAYTCGQEATFKGNTFKPLYSIGNTGYATAETSYVDVNDENGVAHKMLRLTTTGNALLTMMNKDGKPFEVKPGKTYNVNVKAYNVVASNWSQLWFCATAPNFENSTKSGFENYFTNVGYENIKPLSYSNVLGLARNNVAIHRSYSNGGNYGAAVKDLSNYLATPDAVPAKFNKANAVSEGTAALSSFFCGGTAKVKIPSSADFPDGTYEDSSIERYDSVNDTYYFNYPYYNTKTGLTADTPYVGVKEYNNYLYLYISGGTNGDLNADFTVDIESVEVYEDGATTEVTYKDGDTVIKTENVVLGSTLDTAPVKDGYKFANWCIDKDCSTPYDGETVLGNNLVLYARYLSMNRNISVKYYHGDTLIKDDTVKILSNVWEGAVPGTHFEGWYTDSNLTTAYTADTVGEENLELYGKFSPFVENATITSWTTYYNRTNYRHLVNGVPVKDYSVGGWNYSSKYNTNDGKLHLRNDCRWGQSGSYVLHNTLNGDMFIPEPGATYEVSVTYSVPRIQEDYLSSIGVYLGCGLKTEYDGSLRNYGFADNKLVATETGITDGERTVSAILSAPVESNTIIPAMGVFISFSKKNSNGLGLDDDPTDEVVITKVEIKKKVVIGVDYGGISILTDEAAETAGKQAMRVYYSYVVDENGAVMMEGNPHQVVERGILFKAATIDKNLIIENVGKGGVLAATRIKDLDECWAYDDTAKKITFSAYVSGFARDDEREINARGYLILDNGVVCYTAVATNSIKNISDGNKNMSDVKKDTGREKVAIMLVIGQSNAQGAGFGEEKGCVASAAATGGEWVFSEQPTTTDNYGAVYMSTTGSVTALTPAYEYKTSYYTSRGGFSPAYAAQWYEMTGERVVILQLAIGSTKLSEWQKDSNVNGTYPELKYTTEDAGFNGTKYYLYDRAVSAFNETYEALNKNYEISHAFYAWNQGESERRLEGLDDSQAMINNDERYYEYFEKMHNDLKDDCPGLQYGTIVAVRNANGPYSGATFAPRRAQYRLAETHDDIFMASWVTEECNRVATGVSNGITTTVYGADYDLIPSVKKVGGVTYSYSNMHFTQKRYNQMGKDAAINFFKSLNGESSFDGVAIYNKNGTHLAEHLIGKFSTTGAGEFAVENIAENGTLQIRAEDASCHYDIALHIDTATSTLLIDCYADGSHGAHESGDAYISEFGVINWTALAAAGVTSLTAKCIVH